MRPPTRALSVADTLRSLVQRGEVQLPAVPDVTAKLLELIADEDRADAHNAARIIATEPAIAASVLRLANSVAFGGLKQVLELSEAVGRIGMRQVGSLATTIAIQGAFDSKNPLRRERLTTLWNFAITAAVTTRQLSLGVVDPEHAYLAGLLHDIGKPLILKLLDQAEKKLLDPLTPAAVEELMETLHTELGHKLLISWRIPEPVSDTARSHHNPRIPEGAVLLALVQAGDVIAGHLVLPREAREEQQLSEHPAIQRLGLSGIELASLIVDIESRLTILRQIA